MKYNKTSVPLTPLFYILFQRQWKSPLEGVSPWHKRIPKCVRIVNYVEQEKGKGKRELFPVQESRPASRFGRNTEKKGRSLRFSLHSLFADLKKQHFCLCLRFLGGGCLFSFL